MFRTRIGWATEGTQEPKRRREPAFHASRTDPPMTLSRSTGDIVSRTMERTSTDPDQHIAELPAEVRDEIGLLDKEIGRVFEGQPRSMWEGKLWGGSNQKIIGYGLTSYTNSRGEDITWFTVGLAKQKNYISVYVNAADQDGYLLQKYKDRLGKVRTGSANISFGSVDSLDMDAFVELIEAARVVSADTA